MPKDDTEQCCLKMANVKGLVEAIHAVKSPNKSQVRLCPTADPARCYCDSTCCA